VNHRRCPFPLLFCMPQKPKCGLFFFLFDAFKTAIRQSELPSCCVWSDLDTALFRLLYRRALLPPLSLTYALELAPLGLSPRSCLGLPPPMSQLGRQRLHDHSSLRLGQRYLSTNVLAWSSTTSQPLFSHQQRNFAFQLMPSSTHDACERRCIILLQHTSSAS
jgi:hypothetical protein